mmetsp:Transcript_16672/g.18371  ORF Transcript_16672/g.18371 Transcript_16672/m.18371 type:complete len:287 (+) Transcript_16672:180-1040(+)
MSLTFNDNDSYNTFDNDTKIVIEKGLVLLRNFVNDSNCQSLAQAAMSIGCDENGGFYKTDKQTGKRILNTGENRGRIYDKASRFPNKAISICNEAVLVAKNLQTSCMPNMKCTHALLNMYTTSDGICWHRDIYENDGKSDHPVVNLCIGASCKFAFKHNKDDDERSVILNNGDVLLFGGPCRFIMHSVIEVYLNDCPDWMKKKMTATKPYRLSFTFRDSPEVCGREKEFKHFRVKENLIGQDEFQPPPTLSLPSSSSSMNTKNKNRCYIRKKVEKFDGNKYNQAIG